MIFFFKFDSFTWQVDSDENTFIRKFKLGLDTTLRAENTILKSLRIAFFTLATFPPFLLNLSNLSPKSITKKMYNICFWKAMVGWWA